MRFYNRGFVRGRRGFIRGRPVPSRRKTLNLVLGGGGIKGIAYAGVFDIAEKRGYKWDNVVGVSAGAVAGSYTVAGYRGLELYQMLDKYDFSKIDLTRIPEKVPIVNRIMELKNILMQFDEATFRYLLTRRSIESMNYEDSRAGFFKNLITYTQKGCLFDGDFIEEWIQKSLSIKGVRTFSDLRGGSKNEKNPNGYKIRMTAVDCNRAKVLTLPDDLLYYGINPDDFEVSKAIRMSISIPFIFRPVLLKRKDGGKTKTHYIVDGGVLDKFPVWLIGESKVQPTVGFTLDKNTNKGIFSIETPLNILKSLISTIHDIGVPQDSSYDLKYFEQIDTSKVHYMDFNIGSKEKMYLYESGKEAAISLFNRLEKT